MAEYLVLARKYRSRTFDEVVGQEHISQTLKNAIASGRIAHAYLFTGTRGVGKTTMARILAKALNCLKSDGPTAQPCDKCDACVGISRGDDVDVIEIDGASNRGIDEIRELRANVVFRPARCRYKIYYIDEVHMLTREAFNALLKTLEEPPEHVKFIFATTDTEKMPATILSRCQRFDFRNIPTRLIAQHLAELCKGEKVVADQDAIFRVARAGAGSMRDAISLLDQLLSSGDKKVTDEQVVRILGTPSEERMLALAGAISKQDAMTALTELSGVLEAGVSLPTAAAALGEVFRNMMLAATCGPASDLIELPDSQRQAVGELAKKFSKPSLVHAVAVLQSVARNVRDSSLARALLEAAVVRLAEADKFVDPESLVERLEAMRSGEAPLAGEKKKHPSAELSSARPSPAPAASAAAAPAPAEQAAPPPPPIVWQAEWLKANWQAVIAHLMAARQMQVAGALRPATVLDFHDGRLRLGYDGANETLRRRCEGQALDQIEAALGSLAGSAVRCEFVSTGGPAVANVFGELSTEEKNHINKDPAVRQALSFFGGEVTDMHRKPAPSQTPQEDPEQQ